MEMQNLSEDIVFVELQREPQLRDELKTVADVIRDRGGCDVILDFSHVDIVTSSSLSVLLKLRQVLTDAEHRLVLCAVRDFTRSTFGITGLEGLFVFCEDREAACKALERADSGSRLD